MRFRELLEAPDPLAGLPPLGGAGGDPLAGLGAPPADPMAGGMTPPPPPQPTAAPLKKRSKSEASSDAKIATALMVVFNRIKDGDLKPEVKLKTVVALVKNITGLETFTEEDLRDSHDRDPAIKNVIKNITDDSVEFATGEADFDQESDTGVEANPEKVVGDMAKSAMKRRQ